MRLVEYKNRKAQRPFSKTEALHITLRSDVARKELSMIQPLMRNWLRDYLPRLSKRLHVRLYAWSNNGNHIHLVVKAEEKASISKFLRVLCGMIARRALNAERGVKSNIRFWTKRPYSRIITWGREFFNVMRYVERNLLEAKRQIPFRHRDEKESQTVKEELARRVLLNQRSRRSKG